MPQQDHRRNIREKDFSFIPRCIKIRHISGRGKETQIHHGRQIEALKEFSENTRLNRIEAGLNKVGIITSGISYNHAKEVFGDEVSYLKLGFTWPLPEKLIRKFAGMVDTIYVIEENEPYIEDFVKIMGIQCTGREKLPWVDELTPEIIRRAFFPGSEDQGGYAIDAEVPPRPPVLCAGCTHRGFFYEVGKYKDVVVTGDIGCYTLGIVPPLSVTDSVICMGASVSGGVGFSKAVEKAGRKRRSSRSSETLPSSIRE